MMQRSTKQRTARGGFTLIELIVVVAIVLVLLSLVVVAVGSATRTAQRTNTTALMNNIKQGLVHFENDVGYLPPVLRPNRDLVWDFNGENRLNGPDPSTVGQFETQIQDWFSLTSLAEFLLGYGPEGEDGHNGPGIRNPGPDGYWGATSQLLTGSAGRFDNGRRVWLDPSGSFADQSDSYRKGRVFGPYLQLRDELLLGAINPDAVPDANGNFQVFFPGEAGYNPDWPKVIVDFWGEPIRYYRTPYPVGGLNRAYREIRGQDLVVPTLADVYVLRGWRASGYEVDTRFADDNGIRSAPSALQTASFALLSSGPDRRLDLTVRTDVDEFNRDNIVELSP